LTLALCRYFRDTHNIGTLPFLPSLQREERESLFRFHWRESAVVTNDIFTKEDQEFLIRNEALSDPGRIRAIETGE